MLTFKKLRLANVARCQKWHPEGLEEWSGSDWFTAFIGEAGEAGNILKKLNRERDNIVGNTESIDELKRKFADELADTMIYLDLLAARYDIDLGMAVVKKFNTVSERVGFPDRLSND